MKVDLRFEKKGDKIIIQDVSEYSEEDLKSLYSTMDLTFKVKTEQKKNLYNQQKQVEEEIDIIRNRLNQLKKFMESEGIVIPNDEENK